MLGVVADGLRIGKLLILSMTGETKVIVEISLDQLESTRSSMGIVAVKAGDLGLKCMLFWESSHYWWWDLECASASPHSVGGLL